MFEYILHGSSAWYCILKGWQVFSAWLIDNPEKLEIVRGEREREKKKRGEREREKETVTEALVFVQDIFRPSTVSNGCTLTSYL